MTDDDRARYCPGDHRLTPPTPVLIEVDGQWVPHPTERIRMCTECPWEESIVREAAP